MRLVTDPPRQPYAFKLETWLKLCEVWGPETADELCDIPPRDAA